MKLFKLFKRFNDDEGGAVTVDWVVLTAAIVGLGVAALAAIRSGTGSLTTKTNSYLGSATVATTFLAQGGRTPSGTAPQGRGSFISGARPARFGSVPFDVEKRDGVRADFMIMQP